MYEESEDLIDAILNAMVLRQKDGINTTRAAFLAQLEYAVWWIQNAPTDLLHTTY